MRTVLLGTSTFAASVLGKLAAGAHRPVLVVTRPDRPAGRGRQLTSPPVASVAHELEIDVAQPERVNDPVSCKLIAAARPDAVVVCAFGALIKEPLLSAYELINVHPSLLPRWRGAAPIERAIMAGDEQTGVSIMRVTAGLDSGPVCLVEAETIHPEDTYGSLAPRLQALGATLLTRALDELAAGRTPRFAEQDEAGVTYAEKIAASDRVLDPTRPAVELERVVRALSPHIGARIELPGGPLGVLGARALSDNVASGGELAPGTPTSDGTGALAAGELFERDGKLLYATASGPLELIEVKPPGGKAMTGAEYLRGHAR